jgi:hypothetical protein
MTAVFEVADVRITEEGGFAQVELVVGAEPPVGHDWGVQVPVGALAFVDAQPYVLRVDWRGVQP